MSEQKLELSKARLRDAISVLMNGAGEDNTHALSYPFQGVAPSTASELAAELIVTVLHRLLEAAPQEVSHQIVAELNAHLVASCLDVHPNDPDALARLGLSIKCVE